MTGSNERVDGIANKATSPDTKHPPGRGAEEEAVEAMRPYDTNAHEANSEGKPTDSETRIQPNRYSSIIEERQKQIHAFKVGLGVLIALFLSFWSL